MRHLRSKRCSTVDDPTHGTNPDLLVLLEARTGTDGSPDDWQMAAVRMTNCELTVLDGQRELWTAPFIRFADRVGQNLETWTFFWGRE